MTPGRCFVAAAMILLLGASALPEATIAYSLASVSKDAIAIAGGVWAVFVYFAAFVAPVILVLGGIVWMFFQHGE